MADARVEEKGRLTAKALRRVAVETVRKGGGTRNAEVRRRVEKVSAEGTLKAVGRTVAGETAVDGGETAETASARKEVLSDALLADRWP